MTGDVDISKTRYLCEKHFSPNYISNQARRKMLVHTAIPAKWSENIEKVPEFNFIGEASKKRKSSEYTIKEIAEKKRIVPKIENFDLKTSPRVVKVSKVPPSAIIEEAVVDEESDNEITLNRQPNSETYEIKEVQKPESKVSSVVVDETDRDEVYEEITIQPHMRVKKMQYIVVKPKPKLPSKPEIVKVESKQEIYIMEEEEEEAQRVVEENIEEVSSADALKSSKLNQSTELESYSEFIFSGEKYVQMPKRVFEAEKEKLRVEIEKYKTLLTKFKNCLNRIDLE